MNKCLNCGKTTSGSSNSSETCSKECTEILDKQFNKDIYKPGMLCKSIHQRKLMLVLNFCSPNTSMEYIHIYNGYENIHKKDNAFILTVKPICVGYWIKI